MIGRRETRWFAAAALTCLVAAAPEGIQAMGEVGTGVGPAPRHRLEALALLVSPTRDPVKEVYGDHGGIALRYGLRFAPRWSLAAEVGQRSASGSTPVLGSRAELDTLHGALTARFHFGTSAATVGGWDSWVGAGILHQRLDEEIRFPDITLSDDDSATGALLGLGVGWTGRRGWGVVGEARYTRLSASDPDSEGSGADLDGLEAVAGLAYSF